MYKPSLWLEREAVSLGHSLNCNQATKILLRMSDNRVTYSMCMVKADRVVVEFNEKSASPDCTHKTTGPGVAWLCQKM